MNEREALLVIEDMISKTRNDIRDNGFYFLFWGWLVLIAAVINLALLSYTEYTYHSLPWLILMPFGGIVTAIVSAKEKKHERVKTYVGESLKYGVRAFAISMFVVCFAMPAGGQWKAFYPTIMVIYAIWMFVCGGLLKFKPLMWGGALNWCAAIVGFIFASTELHLMLIAIAVLGGYIIPGYLLKKRFNADVQRA